MASVLTQMQFQSCSNLCCVSVGQERLPSTFTLLYLSVHRAFGAYCLNLHQSAGARLRARLQSASCAHRHVPALFSRSMCVSAICWLCPLLLVALEDTERNRKFVLPSAHRRKHKRVCSCALAQRSDCHNTHAEAHVRLLQIPRTLTLIVFCH